MQCGPQRLALFVAVTAGFLAGGTQQQLGGNEPGATGTVSSADAGQLNWGRRASLPARGTAQHSRSIAQPLPSRTATPAHNASQMTVLRWRTPGISRTGSSSNASPSNTNTEPIRIVTLSGAPGSAVQQTHAVRQVSATELDLPAAIPDAFDDPFDDGNRPPAAPPRAPAPLTIEPAAQLVAQQPAPATVADAAWQDDPPPVPNLGPDMNLAPQQPSQQLPPPSVIQPEPNLDYQRDDQRDESLDRIYNRRNCSQEGERCDDARQVWQRDAISKISLDITPSMHPRILDPIEQEQERDRELAESPVRTWHDRDGNFVADGRLTNIKRGRALILDGNNQIVSVPFNELSDDDLCFLTAWWNVPAECTLGDVPFEGRNWAPSTLTWKASALCHKPLYFEQVQLERYGHTAGPIKQPFLSGAHFFASLVTIPYQAGINPPWECRYSLGYYRPGSCAPWLVPPIPLSVRGGLWEAGAIVGGVAIFP